MEKACDRKDGECLSGSTVTNDRCVAGSSAKTAVTMQHPLLWSLQIYLRTHTFSEIGVMYDLLCRNSVVKGGCNDEDTKY